MLISESASTPAINPRKRTFSSSVEPSRQRSSTPPVIPAKRIKRESGGTYAIVTTTSTAKVASPVTVKRKSQLVTTPATPSSILLPAKTSSMSSASLKTTPSLLPSKQQLQSALSSAVVKSSTATTGPIKSNNLNATANARIVSDFDRFDELTDEIFEESDVRFRICHEDVKSGIGTGAILEQVVPSAATGKRKKSESAATDVNGKDKAGKVKPQNNQQRAYSKQPGQYVDGSEESDNAKLPANLGIMLLLIWCNPLFGTWSTNNTKIKNKGGGVICAP